MTPNKAFLKNDRYFIKGFLKKIFTIIIIIWGVVYLYSYQDFGAIKNIKCSTFIFLLIYGFIANMSVAVTFKYQIELFGLNLPFKEWFGLTATNTMYNYFLPARGGLVARAYYLKNKYGFEYSKYISQTAGSMILGFSLSSFFAIFFLLIYYIFYDIFFYNLFYISIILFIVSNIFIILFLLIPNIKVVTPFKRVNNLIISILHGLNSFKSNFRALVIVIIAQIGMIVFLGLRLYFAFLSLDISVNFLFILILQSLVAFSMVLSITPGNLGIKEGIIGLMASEMGVSINDAILAAAIDRTVAMIIVFVFGGIYHFILLKEKGFLKENT